MSIKKPDGLNTAKNIIWIIAGILSIIIALITIYILLNFEDIIAGMVPEVSEGSLLIFCLNNVLKI